MSFSLNALSLVGVLALAGCASSPATQAPTPPAASPALASVAPVDEEMMTGSRIPKRKTTDRMLKTIGAQEARDALDRSLVPLNSDGIR